MDFADKLKKSVVLDSEEMVSKGMSEIAKKDICVVVMKEGVYHGIVDERSLENINSDPASTKLETLAEKAPLIPVTADLTETARYFFAGPYKSLPLGTKEKIEGVLTRNDVLAELLKSTSLSGSVQDYMTAPAVTISVEESIAKAKAKMRESRVRRLIVTKQDNQLAGLLSLYDLVSKYSKRKEKAPFVSNKVPLDNHPIKSFMRSAEEVRTIGPDAPLSTAAKIMVENGIASLVVMDENKPRGLLSARDIFESVLREQKAPVYLSGLDDSDKLYTEEIMDECNGELEKLRKSFEITYLAIHFKKYKHKYSVHARLKTTEHGIILAKNDGFELHGTVHGVLAELKKILAGRKENPIHGRHN